MDYEDLEEQLTTYCDEWCEDHGIVQDEKIKKRFIDTAIETVENYVSGYDCDLNEAYGEYCDNDIDGDLDYFYNMNREG